MKLNELYHQIIESSKDEVSNEALQHWASSYTQWRLDFLNSLSLERPEQIVPPMELQSTLWGIPFRAPLFNAAGLFKKAEAYDTVYLQGAGAYLSGSTTWNARAGNVRDGIRSPWTPYLKSGAASNWMGMPGEGDEIVAKRIAALERKEGFPIGASVSPSPDFTGDEQLERFIDGLRLYQAAGVDFIEIPASSPNAPRQTSPEDAMHDFLRGVKEGFLDQRDYKRPAVVVKFSNDTKLERVGMLVDMLLELGFDGINFGNSSKQYELHEPLIAAEDKPHFQHFVQTFGGAVTGRVLKSLSLALVRKASEHLKGRTVSEFHIIRTGGIECASDVAASLDAGASLVQWHTAYYQNFAEQGHLLYDSIWKGLSTK